MSACGDAQSPGRRTDGWEAGHEKVQRSWAAWRSSGELVQIDDCDHEWGEGRAPRLALLVYVGEAAAPSE